MKIYYQCHQNIKHLKVQIWQIDPTNPRTGIKLLKVQIMYIGPTIPKTIQKKMRKIIFQKII